jgi:hypothetical protein
MLRCTVCVCVCLFELRLQDKMYSVCGCGCGCVPCVVWRTYSFITSIVSTIDVQRVYVCVSNLIIAALKINTKDRTSCVCVCVCLCLCVCM